MSVIGGLLMPQFKPYDLGGTLEQANRIAGGQTTNETALLKLADLKRSQASEQEVMAAIQRDPSLQALLFGGGGSTIAALPTTGGPPGAGPLTQQPFGAGQPPGAPTIVPGGQDLSRFATVSPTGGGPIPPNVMGQVMPQVTPPPGTPTLATIGPQGGMAGPPQPPQNPLLEMARRDPRAAMMLQQQIQGQQDAAMKRQEQRLKIGEATLGYVGQQAQGVTDQASLDAMRSDFQSQGLQQYAAQLPQLYSKEAMQPFITKALAVKDRLTLEVQGIEAQAKLRQAAMSGRVATTDEYLKAIGVTPGTETAQDMQRALELKNRHLAEIQAANVTPQLVQGEGGAYWAVNPRTLERRPVGGGGGEAGAGAGGAGTGEQLRAPMTEGQAKTAGYTSRMQTGQDQLNTLEKSGDYATWKLPLTQLPGGRLLLSGKQKEYETAKGIFLAGLLRYDSAGQITEAEWKQYGDLYFPQYGDEPSQVEQKRQNREQALHTHKEMLGRPVPGQKPSTQGQPTSQAPAASGGQGAKVVTRAALQAENARRNEANRAAGRPEISNEQAEAMAKQKGYTVQ